MMYSALVLIFCSSALALPRQNTELRNSVLDEPLSNPELRRSLLRVFAESLRAAAEAGFNGPRSAVNVPVEEIIDLSPPANNARSEQGFSQQQSDELLVLSGESDPPRNRFSDFSFTTQPSVQQRDTSLEIEQRGIDDADDLVSINLNSELQFESSNQQSRSSEQIDRQTTASLNESNSNNNVTSNITSTDAAKAADISEPTFPGPSPAPPSPTPVAVTIDESSATTKLSADDKKDVQRFVSAVSTSNSTDEKLGDGVELFRAPLIAAFALQQDGETGRTRSLYALPIARGVTEELLNQERHTLSVAGQVIGQQKSGISSQSQFRRPQVQDFNFRQNSNDGRTLFDIQRSVQPQRQNIIQQDVPLTRFETSSATTNFINDIEPAQFQLRQLERRQQELQQQLLSLQRERSALLLQRNTRSDGLQTAASNVYNSGIPIYLQPPFF